MSEYIPLEIQEEILKRLPLKPLIQFRLVSKTWKGLIDSPDFIVSYSVRHPQLPNRFVLRYKFPSYSEYYEDERCIALVDNDDNLVQQDFAPTIPDLVKKIKIETVKVVDSSHGLMCFKGFYKFDKLMIVIWNPSIRKSVGIQVPYIYDSPNENIFTAGVQNVIGFGVCPVTFDPTILKIECIYYKRKMKYMPGVSVPWKVRLFTLSTGTWSILCTNLPRESIRIRTSQVVMDRFIYWVAFDELDDEDFQSQSCYLIVSFDLTAKEFKEINLAGSLTNRLCSIKSISKLRESLVLLGYHREFEEDVSFCCCLWMMKEQSDSRSFTKLYNINLLPDVTINKILGFRKTGEVILERGKQGKPDGELEIYDPNSKAIKYLGISGDVHSFFMGSYMETLFLLDQLDGFIYLPHDVLQHQRGTPCHLSIVKGMPV